MKRLFQAVVVAVAGSVLIAGGAVAAPPVDPPAEPLHGGLPGVDVGPLSGPMPRFQLPFPCNQAWSGGTSSTAHESWEIDFNRDDDVDDPVVAAAAGEVVRSWNDSEERNTGYGNLIIIDHGGGWTTYYAHLNRRDVQVGDEVVQGQPIGRVGNTTKPANQPMGSHLHYEVRTGPGQADIQKAWFNGVQFGYPSQTVTSRNCSATPVEPVERAGASGTIYNERFYSFFRESDNGVVQHVRRPNIGWSRPGLGGSVTSPPSTIFFRGDLWVFARGTSGVLNYRILSGSAWEDWKYLEKPVSGAAGLGVLGERMFVVVREGGALKYRFYDEDTGWNSSDVWLGLGQPASGVGAVSDPVTAVFNQRMYILVRGSDGHLYARSVGAGSGTPGWTSWTQLTGAATGNPTAAVSPDKTELHVIFRAPNGSMHYHTYRKGAAEWTEDRGLGTPADGTFVGSPAAISFGSVLTVYARTSTGQLAYRTLTSAGWHPVWPSLGAPAGAGLDSSPVAMRNYATRYAGVRSADGVLHTRGWSPSSEWDAWTRHGDGHAPMP